MIALVISVSALPSIIVSDRDYRIRRECEMAALNGDLDNFNKHEHANITEARVQATEEAAKLDATKGHSHESEKQDQGEASTVLIVEDFDETRFILKLSLELSGYHVVEAVNGQEAVEVACRVRPDLILMDIGLPVLSGYEATQRIRQDPALHDIPIVAITAHATPECRAKAFAAGFSEYVTKPIDFDQLEMLLVQLLNENIEVAAERVLSIPTTRFTADWLPSNRSDDNYL